MCKALMLRCAVAAAVVKAKKILAATFVNDATARFRAE